MLLRNKHKTGTEELINSADVFKKKENLTDCVVCPFRVIRHVLLQDGWRALPFVQRLGLLMLAYELGLQLHYGVLYARAG
jgi:hypothetical protein